MIQKTDLSGCHARIAPYIHRTPVLTSSQLNQLVGAELFFKCENFQRIGAFKMRGAANAVLQLTEEQRKRGVVTHSSGNFAQALALAARNIGVKAYIVMPSNAPNVKKDAVKGYGGEVIECEPNVIAREAAAKKVETDKGAVFIHPYDNKDVIIGQGSACMELLEEQSLLDAVFTPVGGGGLISGTALAAHFFGKQCLTYGAEPEQVNDAFRSLKSGKIESNASTNTIADGLRTNLGNLNFPIIQQHVKDIITVSEEEITAAMRLIWERMKIVVEPSSAVAFAAVLKEKEKFKYKKVGIILSGGNVDLGALPF
ncbi:MAG: pyridoxal-phosphate dependent enzyme [Bacteroidia bacterium]|jgi:threonine dehydratase